MVITVVRKPFKGSVGKNITLHNIGGINIEECRVGTEDTRSPTSLTALGQNSGWNDHKNRVVMAGSASGRWPANVLLSDNSVNTIDDQSGIEKSGVAGSKSRGWGAGGDVPISTWVAYGSEGYGDTGGASRYFKVIKENK